MGGFFHAPKLKRTGFYGDLHSLPGLGADRGRVRTDTVTRLIQNKGIDPERISSEAYFWWGCDTFRDRSGYVHIVGPAGIA